MSRAAQFARCLDAAVADLTRPAPGSGREWLERNAEAIKRAHREMLAEKRS